MKKNSKQDITLKERFETGEIIKLKKEIRAVKIKLSILFVLAITFVSVIIFLN